MHSDFASDTRGFVLDMRDCVRGRGAALFEFVFELGAKANKSTQL